MSRLLRSRRLTRGKNIEKLNFYKWQKQGGKVSGGKVVAKAAPPPPKFVSKDEMSSALKGTGVKFTSGHIDKMSEMSKGFGDPDKFVVPVSTTPEQMAAIQKAFPGKQIEKQNFYKWKNSADNQDIGTKGLTKEEKDLADKNFKQIKNPTSKQISDAKAVQSLPTLSNSSVSTPFSSKNSGPGFQSKIYSRATVQDKGVLPQEIETGNGSQIKPAIQSWTSSLKYTERSAVEEFTGSAYTKMRERERQGEPPPFEGKVKGFNDAIKKAPNWQGVTYRGMSGIKPGTKAYQALTTVGGEITIEANSSSSRNPAKATSFAGSGPGAVIMRLAVKTGASIEHISHFKSEKEVIIRRGSRYRVVGVARDVKTSKGYYATKVTFIDLEEIHD